jgi:hypothetical protein
MEQRLLLWRKDVVKLLLQLIGLALQCLKGVVVFPPLFLSLLNTKPEPKD